MIFTEKFKPGMGDIGRDNKIKNISIMKMLEDTAGFHADSIKDGINEMDEKKTAWIIMAWRLQVIRRPVYGETLTVETWSRAMEKAHAFRDYLLKAEDGTVLAKASSKWSLINTETHRIVRVTDELSRRYGTQPLSVFESWNIKRPVLPEAFENETEYLVRRRDTDIIGHMHNLNYLDLAYEALPDDIYSAGELDNLEIIYRSEVKLGDRVKIGYFKEVDRHTAAITCGGTLNATVALW